MLTLSGHGEADRILSQLPILLRGKALDDAMKSAMKHITDASAAAAPAEGRSVGGIRYSPRRGHRAARKRLSQSLGMVLRKYSDNTVVVGGPRKTFCARHAHLVEFGFTHTTGGTAAVSGGRKRYAKQQIGLSVRRQLPSREGQRGTQYGPEEFIEGRRFSRKMVRELRKGALVVPQSRTNDARTGAGRRGRAIPGRSFLGKTFEANKAAAQREVEAALRRFTDELTRKYNRAN